MTSFPLIHWLLLSYISYQKANYRIPKTVTDPTILTLEDCKKIIAEAGEKPAAKKTTRKKKA